MSDFKYIVPPDEPKIIRSPGEVGIAPTVSEIINNSCLFNGTNSYLSRTPASAGNRKTWTWSGWVKRGLINGNFRTLFGVNNGSGSSYFVLNITTSETLACSDNANYYRFTTQVFRDPSAWYHIVCAVDTTDATANNRIRFYVNGSEITSFSTLANPSQNADLGINQAAEHAIGRIATDLRYFDGYLTEINFIDGQALTPSSFGQYSNRTNTWVPKRYLGSYGTNGFYLKFNNSAALGTDSSGNGNTWTLNNITSTNQTTDSPTNNFCTFNPLKRGSTYANLSVGNLRITGTTGGAGQQTTHGTIGMSYGKWYAEATITTVGAESSVGIARDTQDTGLYVGSSAFSYGYYFNGLKYNNSSGTSYGASYTTGDIIGIAFDADAGTVTFYKNNINQGTAFTGLTSGPYVFEGQGRSATSGNQNDWNFGQRPFTYSPPTGFKSLCTSNLNIPVIRKPNQFFDAKTYTGTGSTQSITGFNFVPDLVWLKSRSTANWNFLFDTIRGVGKWLASNQTGAEATNASSLTSFDSNGFSVSTDPAPDTSTGWNIASANQIAWSWCAGSSTVTNTAGSITSTVRANPIAGFSIVSYTGNGNTSATIGHGLGAVPKMIIVKERSTNVSGWNTWLVYHSSLGNTKYLLLNTTGAEVTSANAWNNTSPTSSVFTVALNAGAGLNYTSNYIAYCFAEIDGYSRFGSYTGNGSSDGPFVWCGFRPRWVMMKQSSAGGTNWVIDDTARGSINYSSTTDPLLYPNLSIAEANGNIDVLSNGFKIRHTDGDYNASGGTYIFAAFAESPFKYANAR